MVEGKSVFIWLCGIRLSGMILAATRMLIPYVQVPRV